MIRDEARYEGKALRLYYADSLAAAWMGKHFGMRFNNWISGREYPPVCVSGNASDEIRVEERFVIHPESIQLLEPRIGDTIEVGAGSSRCATICNSIHLEAVALFLPLLRTPPRIARRDGKPFFWPLREKKGSLVSRSTS